MKYRSRVIPLVLSLSLAAVLLLGSAVPQPSAMAKDIPEPQDSGLSPLDDSPPPLPTDGKEKADSLSSGTEVPSQHIDPAPDESSPLNSEMLTIEAHHIVSPRDLSAEGSSIQVPAAPDGWTTIMSEDFEGAFPGADWNVYDYNGAIDGEYYWDDVSYKSHNGAWSAWPANGGADAIDPPADYANNMFSMMVYGPFDLSDAVDARLLFYYWLQSEPGFDYFGWGASIDGHNFYGSRTSGTSGGWVAQNFDLTAVPTLGDLTGQFSVWIVFVFTSDSSVTYEGVYVDDVLLEKFIGERNLTPFARPGWDQPLVPSSVTDTETVGTLYTYQDTYIDWAVINSGNAVVSGTFSSCLYFDSTEIQCWATNDDLGSGSQAYVLDWILNLPPTAGWHNLGVVVDVFDDILETNELDNSWSADFYWHPNANLTPYKQGSWDYPLVPSSLTGTHSVSDLYTFQTTYIDWTIKNLGPDDILAQFDTCIYLDDVELNCWYTDGKIAGYIASIEDWILDVTPSPGLHNLKIVTDVNDDVAESDETDNTWSKDFYWHPDANLTPYKPGSWTNPIVPSTLTGTNTVNDLYVHLDTYIDWAVINSGPENIIAQFETCLYLDDVDVNCWYTSGKIAGNIVSIEDWILDVTPSPGLHNLKIVTDVNDDVAESDETDNTWAADFYWNPSPNADIYVSPSSLTSQQPPNQVKTLKLDIHNYGSASLDWSIFESPTGSCSAADIPWVSVSPDSGTTAPVATTPIDVVFDSTGLAIGVNQGVLCVNSNDPDEPLTTIPITLETVEELNIFLPMLFRP